MQRTSHASHKWRSFGRHNLSLLDCGVLWSISWEGICGSRGATVFADAAFSEVDVCTHWALPVGPVFSATASTAATATCPASGDCPKVPICVKQEGLAGEWQRKTTDYRQDIQGGGGVCRGAGRH